MRNEILKSGKNKRQNFLGWSVRVKAITILSRQGSHSDGRSHTDTMSSKLKLCVLLFLKAHLENVRKAPETPNVNYQ